MINETLLSDFFRAGKQEALSAIPALFSSRETENESSVIAGDFSIAQAESGSLTDGEIVRIIKSFAVKERVLPFWKSGCRRYLP